MLNAEVEEERGHDNDAFITLQGYAAHSTTLLQYQKELQRTRLPDLPNYLIGSEAEAASGGPRPATISYAACTNTRLRPEQKATEGSTNSNDRTIRSNSKEKQRSNKARC